MIAYKLFTKRKNGTLGPLFINKRQVIPLNIKLKAESHRTKRFAFRPGWHSALKKLAPHLSKKGRVWCEVFVEDYKLYERPKSQGGYWVLSNYITVLRELTS